MTRHSLVFLCAMFVILPVGYLDFQTGSQVSMLLGYAATILVASWYCGKTEGLIVACTAATSWLSVQVLLRFASISGPTLLWNTATRLGIFLLIAYAVSLQASLKSALKREKWRADTDRLTGLLNMGAFRCRVEEEISRAQRYNHQLSLAFIDLDNFKQVNDIQGHTQGDKLLQQVADTMVSTLRKTDIVGRIGGDEFAIFFPETDEAQARRVIGSLAEALETMTRQHGWQVTASIGVVTCTRVCETYDTLLGKADQLMYATKEKGKNSAEFMVIGPAPETNVKEGSSTQRLA